jgi:hypothetical protein
MVPVFISGAICLEVPICKAFTGKPWNMILLLVSRSVSGITFYQKFGRACLICCGLRHHEGDWSNIRGFLYRVLAAVILTYLQSWASTRDPHIVEFLDLGSPDAKY